MGGEIHFRTLVEYLTHFAGRFAVPVTAFGPPGTGWERDRGLLFRALGLPGGGAPGDKAQLTLSETGPATGVIHFVNASTIGVRAPGAFYARRWTG